RHTRCLSDWSSDVCSSDLCYQHSWGSQPNALAILFLPCFVRKVFEDDGIAHRYDLMHFASTQTLAVRREPAFLRRLPLSCLLVEIGRASCRESVLRWDGEC